MTLNELYSKHKGLWVEKYDYSFLYPHILYNDRNEFVISLIKNINCQSKICLDVGCGYGDVSIILSKHFKEVYGVDIVKHNINQAILNCQRFNIKNVYLFHYERILNFKNNFFDYIFSLDVFEHIPPMMRKNHLNELKRVLKKGGLLILITPDRKIIKIFENFEDFFYRFLKSKKPSPILNAPYNHFLTKMECKNIMKIAGFYPEFIKKINFYPAPERGGIFMAINKFFIIIKLKRLFNLFFRTLFRLIEKFEFLNQKMVFRCYKI